MNLLKRSRTKIDDKSCSVPRTLNKGEYSVERVDTFQTLDDYKLNIEDRFLAGDSR